MLAGDEQADGPGRGGRQFGLRARGSRAGAETSSQSAVPRVPVPTGLLLES